MKHCAPLLLTLLLCTGAFADVVHLKDGRKLEGEARWTASGDLELKQRLGTMTFKKGDVLHVEKKETARVEYERRLRALDPNDLAAGLDLAEFCVEKGLEKEARPLLIGAEEEARQRSRPRPLAGKRVREVLAEARKLLLRAEALLTKLEFHKEGERWVPPEEWYPKNGYVRVGKKWVTEAEAARRKAGKANKAAEEEAKKEEVAGRRAAREAKAADAVVARKQKAYDKASDRVKHYRREVNRLTGVEASINTKLAGLRLQESAAQIAAGTCCRALVRTTGRHAARCPREDRLDELQREIKAAEKTLARARKDTLEARRQLGKAEKALRKAKGELEEAKRKSGQPTGDGGDGEAADGDGGDGDRPRLRDRVRDRLRR